MAAIRQQGTYLGTTLAGFTALVAGLYGSGGRATLVAAVGVALLLYSGLGFYRVKSIA